MTNITMKRFIDRSNLPAPLIRAVVKQSGGWNSFQEMARDVATHGADAGFSGWIYYRETMEFFRKNRKVVLEYAEEMAQDLGEPMLSMIQGFGIFRDAPIDTQDLAKALYAGKGPEVATVYNVMSWFSLEEVARAYDDL